MGIIVYSLLWVMQDFVHQQYEALIHLRYIPELRGVGLSAEAVLFGRD